MIMPEVSIIVPVYNAEQALDRCISSILNQEYRDIELILMDDGSKDGSASICDSYAEKDSRVKVVHKENSGVSDTRNQGIERATGKYIQFLDADDWITSDSTKMLVRTAEETDADLVVGEFYRVVGDHLSRKGSIESDRVLTQQEYAEFMKLSPADYYYGVIWNKLYRKEILDTYQIRMDSGISFCEDFIFNLEYVLHCKRIAPLNLPVYYYVKTEGSLVSQNMSLKRLYDMKTSVYQYYDSFFRNVLDEAEYRKERPGIAAFLVSAATDEFTIPFVPGTKKVGEEKLSFYSSDRHVLSNAVYDLNKLYEHLLHTVALKHELSLNEVKVFSAIRAIGSVSSLKELADRSGVGETHVLAALQVLATKPLIRVSFAPLSASIMTDRGAGLMHDLDHAEADFETMCLEGLNETDREAFLENVSHVLNHIRTALSQ